MRDIPIIMSAPMVRALLQGRKTMTRRLAKRKVPFFKGSPNFRMMDTPWCSVEPGDRLYVRETHWRFGRWLGYKDAGNVRYSFDPLVSEIVFDADHEITTESGKFAQAEPAWHRRPPIFLERKSSRLTMVVEAVKIEPLQEISAGDAYSEGIEWRDGSGWAIFNPDGTMRCGGGDDPRDAFRCLWINLHGNGSWEPNPEVVALSFKVHQQNIDALARAA